jgi:WD40 repeat protein
MATDLKEVGNLDHPVVYKVVVSQDGKYVISAGGSVIKIWDSTNNFQQVGDELNHEGVDKIVASPDGNYVISAGGDVIKIWDINNNFKQVDGDLNHQGVYDIIVSPDNTYLISVSEDKVMVWDMKTNFKEIAHLDHKLVFDVMVSKDGKYLISVSFGNGIIKVWDIVNNFQQVGDNLGHKDISYISLSADGKYLISSSSRGNALYLWDFNLIVSIVSISDLNIDQIELFLRVASARRNSEPLMLSPDDAAVFNNLSDDLKAYLRTLQPNIDNVVSACMAE